MGASCLILTWRLSMGQLVILRGKGWGAKGVSGVRIVNIIAILRIGFHKQWGKMRGTVVAQRRFYRGGSVFLLFILEACLIPH